jgi:hypothetical protein
MNLKFFLSVSQTSTVTEATVKPLSIVSKGLGGGGGRGRGGGKYGKITVAGKY